MRDLHKHLKLDYPNNLPQFPPKKFFGNLKEKFINQREKALENYFIITFKSIVIDKAVCLKSFLYKNKNEGSSVVEEG